MIVLSSDSTKNKIKNSHFRYSTVDFRYTTSITSGSQPRTITSGSLYLVSNYGITSGFNTLLTISGFQLRNNFRLLYLNYVPDSLLVTTLWWDCPWSIFNKYIFVVLYFCCLKFYIANVFSRFARMGIRIDI
jgi:hypothetical protein